MKKGQKLYSILKFKCPHCHEGDFFVSQNPYNLKKAGDIHQNCTVCGRSQTIEPGFYYGAMYIAYLIAVISFLITFGIVYLVNPEASNTIHITAILIVLVVLGPWIYAVSKTIWINMFVSYKGVEKTEEEISKLHDKNITSQHLHT
jgi:hypothetical protein